MTGTGNGHEQICATLSRYILSKGRWLRGYTVSEGH